VEHKIRTIYTTISIATTLRGGRSGVPIQAGAIDCQQNFSSGSEPHPASYSMGTGVVSRRVERPGRDADHSPPSSVEIKNEWSYTSTLPMRLHGVFRDNHTFLPTLHRQD